MDFDPRNAFVLGVDVGTSSVRALVLHADSGEEVASAESGFPLWNAGLYQDPARSVFRQHPAEHIEAFSDAVSVVCRKAGGTVSRKIQGITVDTTGSTPCAVDRAGIPLALLPRFKDVEDAMLILWKDHSATPEAEEITESARRYPEKDYLAYCGGIYSAEWYWAKILHVCRTNPVIAEAAASWVEHCDWITALLCGNTDPFRIKRSRCAAGHKALWNSSFGGYPPGEFFRSIDPVLEKVRSGLPVETMTSDTPAGNLCPEWAARLGLPEGITVGVGLFDAHASALGAGIGRGTVVKVIGTSSSEMVVADESLLGSRAVPGIESQAEGSILPGMITIEAGQPAFGDIFAWFRNLLAFPLVRLKTRGLVSEEDYEKELASIIPTLSEAASRRDPRKIAVVAMDWFNGRRAPFANHCLKAGIIGLGLETDATDVFAGLVYATAFGTRSIHELLRKEGIPIERVVAVGGIPRKSPYIMQILADVLSVDVLVRDVSLAGARGAALLAANAAGIYPDLESALSRIRSSAGTVYHPRQELRPVLDSLYRRYLDFGRFIEFS